VAEVWDFDAVEVIALLGLHIGGEIGRRVTSGANFILEGKVRWLV
jgi:hypothetical protein